MNKKFYITTAIPYVNAAPHIGHALEFVQADTVARYQRLLGKEVLLLSGGDENALKNVRAAEAAGIPIQKFVDKNTQLYSQLAKKLTVQFDVFQKGSDQKYHFPSSQKLWKLCNKNGDIYKKTYSGLYCLGCEAFYTEDELDEKGECPEHPGKKLERVSEENYFFRLSRYQNQLIDLISSDFMKIVPESRKNEVLSFLKQPLKDLSISRTNERAKNWGVPVPNDKTQRIYVWFDALNIYQSGIGFGWDEEKYCRWWPADVHVIGKGIIRFHAVYWPAFLLSAGLPLPKSLFVHGYFTVEGQKMSKTLGNVIDPMKLIQKYGADPLRYYFLREMPAYGDGDFSLFRFKEIYNADLANGLGNLVARTAKLCEKLEGNFAPSDKLLFSDTVKEKIENYRFNEAAQIIWDLISEENKHFNQEKPWGLDGKKLKNFLSYSVTKIRHIAIDLQPCMPQTAEKILKQFTGPKIKSEKPLFPRLEKTTKIDGKA